MCRVLPLVCTPSGLPEIDLQSHQMRPTFVPKETDICSKRDFTGIQALRRNCMKGTCIHTKRDQYVYQKRLMFMSQKNYMCSERDFTCMPKETYVYTKRDLYAQQKRPKCIPKETDIHVTRDLCVL